MKHLEKKYRVNSFTKILKRLNKIGAKKGQKVVTTHYYVKKEDNDVVKLVEYFDKNEIHILEESKGKYSLKENISVPTIKAGLQWLKNKGYKIVDVVKMIYTDFEYKSGTIGLYMIDDFLNSVILDFPEGQHKAIEKELGLGSAEVINIPYNKLLEKIGRLHLMDLK